MKSILRTGIVSIVLAGLMLTGYWQIRMSDQTRANEELRILNTQLERRVRDHQEMIERLSRSRRLAHVQILDQIMEDDGGVVQTTLRLIELDDEGGELARRDFTIPGDMLFIDAWTVKFDHDKVAQGHPLFGRTLLLLRRIYSDRMAPIDGFPIDTPGSVPPGYAVGAVSQFERKIWRHFWELATDPELARLMDVRVAQGEVVYKPVRKDQTFELIVDATGGMSLTPLPVADGTAMADE